MSATQNCIICAQHGKRVAAVMQGGWVLLLTDEKREEVIAGFCSRHRNTPVLEKRHISRKRGCLGMWQPDYGRKP